MPSLKRQPKPKASAADSPRSEIRKHYFLPRFVIFAPRRQHTIAHASTPAPFPLKRVALEKEASLYELCDSSGKWQVKVITNKLPALEPENLRAYGYQEMVIESPENTQFSGLSVAHIQKVFQVYGSRWLELKNREGIGYVSIFKNHGQRAGASQLKSHTQIIALPLVPPAAQEEADATQKFQAMHGGDPLCDIIGWETIQQKRLIFEDEHAVALAPYASSAPFSAWILPKRHLNNITELNSHESHSIAMFLKKITERLDKFDIHYNFFLQNSLDGYNQHFIIKIVPRAQVWAGFELDTGIPINAVLPEYATSWYRDEI